MNLKKGILIASAVVIVGAIAYFIISKNEKSPTIFNMQVPTTGNIGENVTATGTVQIVDTVAVGTQVSGLISNIYVDYNSQVKKGQLLATIDPTLLQAQADQIKGNIASAQSTLVYQNKNFDRQKQLYNLGAISKADYDQALSTLQQAKASLSALDAQLRSANKNLAYTKIYSPMDGVVLSRNVSVGQTVAASFSTPTLFIIAKDITKMMIYASVDEADIANIKTGLEASFTVDAYIDDVFKGAVKEVRLQPTTSSNVVTYSTLIEADNTSLKLKPGMTATVTINTLQSNDALLLPVKAIKYTPANTLGKEFNIQYLKDSVKGADMATIWVKQGSNLVQKAVKIGLNDNTHIEIKSGIAKTDSVILNQLSAAEAKATSSSSPFMPKPPSRKK